MLIHCPFCKSVMITKLFSSFGFKIDGKFTSAQIGRPDRPGYHPEKNDSAAEVRADMKVLEEKMTQAKTIKEHYRLKRALDNWAEVHEDIL